MLIKSTLSNFLVCYGIFYNLLLFGVSEISNVIVDC